MKKSLLKNVLPLLGLLVLSILPTSSPASLLIDNLNKGESQTLVLYGTSLTQYGRWADITAGHSGLRDWLTASYGSLITVVNSGMAGKGSDTGVANLSTKVLAYHPDTVMIEFSINDADTDLNISLAQSRANLISMINSIRAADASTEIILLTMNPAIDINNHTNGSLRPDLANYYQIYRDVASEYGLQLIDTYANWINLQQTNLTLFESTNYLGGDGLHPQAPGSLAVTLPAIELALAVPEPSHVTLLLIGCLGSLGLKRVRCRF